MRLFGLMVGVLMLAGPVVAQTPSAVPTPSATPLSAWVQIGAGGRAQVRVVVAAAAPCPGIEIDAVSQPLARRIAGDEAFPTVCQRTLPASARRVTLGGRSLPLPATRPRRILILGDTGCRLKGLAIQDCNDPRAWPFAQVAARAAAEKPDLVIHVGDFYYRESACPLNLSGCAGSAHGDLWPSWDQDFFTPAKPLLEVAPWVMARGNHESCGRGGLGWFRLLDAGETPLACPGDGQGLFPVPAFIVPIGGADLWVLDGADAEDQAAPPARVAAFAAQFDAARTLAGDHPRPAWIITHRPVWGQVAVAKLGPLGPLQLSINRTEQAALSGKLLQGVDMVISGHIHHFASFDFGRERPAQLIVGTGGDAADAADRPSLSATTVEIDGMEARALTFQRFGYFILERQTGRSTRNGDADVWTGTFKDVDGKPVATCRLHARHLTCEGV